jgi:hypothetical protein
MWAHTRSKCLSQSIVLSRSPFSHSCAPLKGVCIPSRKQRMRTSAAIADCRSLENQGLVLCRAGPPMLCARPRPPGHASDVASWLAMLPFLIAMLVAPGPPAAHHVIQATYHLLQIRPAPPSFLLRHAGPVVWLCGLGRNVLSLWVSHTWWAPVLGAFGCAC